MFSKFLRRLNFFGITGNDYSCTIRWSTCIEDENKQKKLRQYVYNWPYLPWSFYDVEKFPQAEKVMLTNNITA